MILSLKNIRDYIQKKNINNKIDFQKPYIKCLGILNIKNADGCGNSDSIGYLEHVIRDRVYKLRKVIVTIKGPENTLYEKGVFRVSIEFPENYPEEKPELKFINKIAHIQVHESSGHICVLFINEWNKNTSLIEILVGLYLFFIYDQNRNSPYYSDYREAYSNYEESKIKFKEYVDKYIENYATPTGSDLELIKKMEKDEI